MRFFNIFLLVLFFAIGSNNALADGGSTEKSQHLRSDSHAPISIMGDHMHKKDEFMVSYRYMFMGMDGYQSGSSSSNYTEARKNPLGGNYMTVPEEMDMKMHMIGAMYAIDDDITLMIMGSYIDNEMKVKKHMNKATKTLESSGWGDTKFTALKNLHHDRNFKLHGSLGLSLPTGSITKKDVMFKTTEETLGYNMQLGSGTYDLLPAFTAVLLEEEYSFGAQISSVFRIGQNSKDYALGDIYKANIWFAVPFNEDKTSISIASQYKYQDKIEGSHKDIKTIMSFAQDRESSGGKAIDVSVGLNHIFTDLNNVRLSIEYIMPTYNDVNSVQLDRDNSVMLGIQYAY